MCSKYAKLTDMIMDEIIDEMTKEYSHGKEGKNIYEFSCELKDSEYSALIKLESELGVNIDDFLFHILMIMSSNPARGKELVRIIMDIPNG